MVTLLRGANQTLPEPEGEVENYSEGENRILYWELRIRKVYPVAAPGAIAGLTIDWNGKESSFFVELDEAEPSQ